MNKHRLFYRIFKVELDRFTDKYFKLFGLPSFDLFKFEDWVRKEYGYNEEKHGSLRDFVKAKWGESAVKLIESLF